MYEYVVNDPVNFRDIDGLQRLWYDALKTGKESYETVLSSKEIMDAMQRGDIEKLKPLEQDFNRTMSEIQAKYDLGQVNGILLPNYAIDIIKLWNDMMDRFSKATGEDFSGYKYFSKDDPCD